VGFFFAEKKIKHGLK